MKIIQRMQERTDDLPVELRIRASLQFGNGMLE
jgi:hypothetical protein